MVSSVLLCMYPVCLCICVLWPFYRLHYLILAGAPCRACDGYCKLRYICYQTLYRYPLLLYSGLLNEWTGSDKKLGSQGTQKEKNYIMVFVCLDRNKWKQAQLLATAETASRKPIEHFIHLMHNSPRHHNCWIYHDFELMLLTCYLLVTCWWEAFLGLLAFQCASFLSGVSQF